MEIKDRLRKVREYNRLSQPEFARALGISNGHVALMELGKRKINDRMIKSVCVEFGISERWLRTGEGEMINRTNQDLLKILGDKIKSLSQIEKVALIEYLKLPNKQREKVMEIIKKLTS